MNIIIVDANILFSGVLNVNSQIGRLLLTSRRFFRFYATEFLRKEIENHLPKLAEISGLSSTEVELIVQKLFQRLNFVPEESIPFEFWRKSAVLVRDIDPDDISYVALNEFMEGRLWTGDVKLRKGLIAKGYTKCITTKEMVEWRTQLRLEQQESKDSE
ncbi:MAG TPA: PIN domain-containing protein [Saprospiraceae bacterium]|nr:PIN domain-containing protein [Saprospiraceae bacterium]